MAFISVTLAGALASVTKQQIGQEMDHESPWQFTTENAV